MAQKSKKYFSLMVVVMAVGLIVAAKFWIDAKGVSLTMSSAQSRAKGDPQAALKIEEYIDFQCPACAEGAKLLRQYLDQHPGAIYLQLRHFPLYNNHRHAMMSARYAQCAALQDKFWPFHDLLIDHQKDWENLTDARSTFDGYAQQSGLDLGQLQKCIESDKIESLIVKEKAQGQAKGVKSTPTYFIGSQMIVGKDALKKFLDQKLSGQTQEAHTHP